MICLVLSYYKGNYMNNKYVYVDFSNLNTKEIITLKYKLFDNNFTNKWFSLLNHVLSLPDVFIDKNGEFFGPEFKDINLIVDGLNNNIKIFNDYASKNNFPDRLNFKASVGMSRELLVEMHDKFEEYAHDNRYISDPDVYKALSEFNTNIHSAENFLPEVVNNGSHCQAIPYPMIHIKLQDEDYDHFTTDYNWGDLYVTYGMSGQPTLNAFFGKSVPRPQDCMTAGLQMMFLNDLKLPPTLREEAKIWLMENYHIDIENKKSAMGFLHLGKLQNEIKDRKEFLKTLNKYKNIVAIRTEGEVEIPFSKLVQTDSGAGEHVITKRGTKNLNIDDRMKSKIKKGTTKQTAIRNQIDFFENIGEFYVEPKYPFNQEARWPFDKEIFYHLDYRPYIDLQIKFNPKPMLNEAFKAIHYFVEHRSYDQSKLESDGGSWKSLSIQSVNGDYTKTSYHTEYNLALTDDLYKKTVFAQLCPYTVKFIEALTDFQKCERVRFMLLEPGAKIHPHRDMKDGSTGMAINISLNMPKDCNFYADLNSDGSSNTYTTKIPFSNDGSVILFNNGKYHMVENNSNEPRMHIIFHGPIKLDDDDIIKIAREQNSVKNRKEIVQLLGKKKIDQVEDLEKDNDFYNEWKSHGYSKDSHSSQYSFNIIEHNLETDIHDKVTDQITLASIFPKSYNMVNINTLDSAMIDSYQNGDKFFIGINQGTFIKDIRKFNIDLEKAFREILKNDASAMAHIMDFQDDTAIPYFHEQFFIIDLEKWGETGFISLGQLFSERKITFPSYERSKEMIHDDYTPLWIKPGSQINSRIGNENFGTEFISESFNRNFKIINIISELRDNKSYCYPLQKLDNRYDDIRSEIFSRLSESKKLTFYFNNEDLDFINLPNFKPENFISVSAGLKPIKMAEIFWKDRAINKSTFIDYSTAAIDYMKNLLKCTNKENISDLISKLSINNPGERFTYDQSIEQINTTIKDYFRNDEELFLNSLSKLKNSKLIEFNLIDNYDNFYKLIENQQPSIVWLSNAFYCNPVYYIHTKKEVDRRFKELGKGIAKHYNHSLWKHKTSYTMIVSNDPSKEIKAIITDGCVFEK